jgi:hypothetical protein
MKSELDKALDVLQKVGRTHFCKTAKVTRAQCIAAALPFDENDVVTVAMQLLEGWNGHLSVAAIQAIEKEGNYARFGRTLRITLPKHWNDQTSLEIIEMAASEIHNTTQNREAVQHLVNAYKYLTGKQTAKRRAIMNAAFSERRSS